MLPGGTRPARVDAGSQPPGYSAGPQQTGPPVSVGRRTLVRVHQQPSATGKQGDELASCQYSVEVQNQYLGKFRRVTGRSRREVEIKAAEQLQRWSEQEAGPAPRGER